MALLSYRWAIFLNNQYVQLLAIANLQFSYCLIICVVPTALKLHYPICLYYKYIVLTAL